MVLLRKLSIYRRKDSFNHCIERINQLRAHYPWSKLTYDGSKIDYVYLIWFESKIVGFLEASYNELDICFSSNIILHLHELHISPSLHRRGIGRSVFIHLLSKGVKMQMVVVNDNENMIALVNRFNVIKQCKSKKITNFIIGA